MLMFACPLASTPGGSTGIDASKHDYFSRCHRRIGWNVNPAPSNSHPKPTSLAGKLTVHGAMDCVRVIAVREGRADCLLCRVEYGEHIETQGTNNKHGDDGNECDQDAVLHHRGSAIATEASRQMPPVGKNWWKHSLPF